MVRVAPFFDSGCITNYAPMWRSLSLQKATEADVCRLITHW